MTYDDYNAFCKTLPATNYVMQWGSSHVWKVGTKVFAIGGWHKEEDRPAFSFKVSPLSFDIMKDQPGLRPAPYLAARGMKWIQHFNTQTVSDNELKDYLTESHYIVSLGLTKKLQKELGLNQ